MPERSPKLVALAGASLSASEAGLDRLIRTHASFVRRNEKRTMAIVSDTDAMIAALRERAATLGAPEAQRRVDQTIDQLQEIQDAHVIASTKSIRKAARAEAAAMSEAVLEVAGSEFGVRFGALSPNQIKAIADQRFLGASLEEYAGNLSAVAQFRLGRELQASYALGEGFDQMVARLQTVGEGTQRELATLARTTIQAAANQAAVETYAANDDVLDGMTWVATLDSTTCERCGPLDAQDYYYRPTGGQLSASSMPKAPLHPNCRCFLAPIVSGFPKAEVPKWSDWITRQPPHVQDDALGPGRADLLRRGVVDPSEFITKTGALRPVETLRRAA